MKNLKIVTIVSMIILAFSCENDLSETAEYLTDNKWILLGVLHNDTNVEESKPDNLKEMNIEFSDTNRFHAISSCNSFDGYYSVSDPDLIIIDSVITTLIYCANDTVREWEEKYFNELKNAANYNIIGNRLTIETISDIDLIFRAD